MLRFWFLTPNLSVFPLLQDGVERLMQFKDGEPVKPPAFAENLEKDAWFDNNPYEWAMTWDGEEHPDIQVRRSFVRLRWSISWVRKDVGGGTCE